MSKDDVAAQVGSACAQYVPDDMPSDPQAFLASVPDTCKAAFEAVMAE